MSSDFEWGKMLFAMGLLIAMFLYPVLSLWHDERKQRGDPLRNIDECNLVEDDPWLCPEPSARQTTAEMQPDAPVQHRGAPPALSVRSDARRGPSDCDPENASRIHRP